MRNFLQAVMGEPDNSMAFVESDERFDAVREAMICMRGYNPHIKMTRSEYDEIRHMQQQFTECIAGLEADYDVPAEVIRAHIIRTVKSLDN